MSSKTKDLSNILDKVTNGNLADVFDDVTTLELTYDTRMRIIDSFNRRLKKLNGELLSWKEKDAAEKLLYYLTEDKVNRINNSAIPYLHQISSIYRHMLIKEKCLLLEVGERLLVFDENSATAGYDPNIISLLRNNLYAYSWNFLRENHQVLQPEDSLQIVSQALRWLIRQGEKSFSSASHKLQQMTHIITTCKNYNSVENFIKTICGEGERVWLTNLDHGAWKQDPLQLDGFINTMVSSIRCTLCFGDFKLAKQSSQNIFEIFGPYFDPELSIVVEKVANYFTLFAESIAKRSNAAKDNDENTENDVMILVVQLIKLVEQFKAAGVRLTILYGFLQGICCYIQAQMKDARNWTYPDNTKDFERLISALFKLTHSMRLSSSHNDISHLDRKRRDLESVSYLLILRMVSEYINCKKESTFTIMMVTEKCFEGLNRLCNIDQKSKDTAVEIYTKMNYHGGQIGTNLIRMKDFNGAIKILLLSIEVADKLCEIEDMEVTKVDPAHLGVVVADAYSQMKEHDSGLKFLAEMLYKYPYLMDKSRHTPCVDVLEPISWYNWNYQWISMKRNAASSNCKDLMCKSVADYLLVNKKFSGGLLKNNKELLLRILHFEFNSYFTTKSVIPDGLISVGENLQIYGNTRVSQAIGLLSQGIGFWWGDVNEIKDSIELCQDALKLLEKESESTPGNSVVHLTVAIVNAWLSLGFMRKFQDKAVIELEVLKNDDVAQNPKKYSSLEDERVATRVIPAISSLNIADEALIATHLTKAIDILYDMLSIQEGNLNELENWIEKLGSGVVLATLRLMTDISTSLGNKYTSFKCLCVTKTVAELYNRTYLQMLATSEMMKACPSAVPQLMVPMEKLKDTIETRKKNALRNPSLYFMRLTLARAIAHMHSKEYPEAISSLAEIFKYRVAPDIFDVGHHILGEAYFVLAELKLLEIDFREDLAIPKYVKFLTPVGLVSKGFKILSSVSRTPNPTESGWNDLFHNYNILATIMEVSDKAIRQYYLCGKLREARCIAADFIYLAQQMALVSRTINLVIPLAEMDITSRNFDSCQQKMECLISMLKGHVPSGEEKCNPANFLQKLHLSVDDFKRIVENDNDMWHISYVSLPEHNYGPYGPPPASRTESPTITEPRRMRRVTVLDHSLNCRCYVCTHPKIVPSILRFYCLQARLASCSKNMQESGKILEAANRNHLKTMLRIMNSFEVMKNGLALYVSDTSASEILNLIYREFFVEPGVQLQMTKLEAMPAMDLKESIPSFNQVLEGLSLMDSNRSTYTSIPLETLIAAVFNCVFLRLESKIKRADLRNLLKSKNDAEDNQMLEGMSPERLKTPPPRACKPPLRKGLNKRYDIEDSDDENLPEKETCGTKKKIPFKLDDIEDSEDTGNSNTTVQLVGGPSRNTRSRFNSTDNLV
ncbi:unnamed protein product [Allacma fusca]|uniref:Uncharacterized protein n=1 Tax=Allacma fusca TaxID=39272 RepID=A0A8J2KA25_9HEXA|nr:unnamed protein product [Allacma fusca]